jgi:hypothetical protein
MHVTPLLMMFINLVQEIRAVIGSVAIAVPGQVKPHRA